MCIHFETVFKGLLGGIFAGLVLFSNTIVFGQAGENKGARKTELESREFPIQVPGDTDQKSAVQAIDTIEGSVGEGASENVGDAVGLVVAAATEKGAAEKVAQSGGHPLAVGGKPEPQVNEASENGQEAEAVVVQSVAEPKPAVTLKTEPEQSPPFRCEDHQAELDAFNQAYGRPTNRAKFCLYKKRVPNGAYADYWYKRYRQRRKAGLFGMAGSAAAAALGGTMVYLLMRYDDGPFTPLATAGRMIFGGLGMIALYGSAIIGTLSLGLVLLSNKRMRQMKPIVQDQFILARTSKRLIGLRMSFSF